ncbi:Aldo/keto reductase family-domain-containing protein [Lasiosphaeria miniovina]|uniref:Aldo/keto reductase family-domain-containing protein n=1 Tax=Lasiosphaeria miniovina TaxID=1954250 RepID=A0AA40DQ10_9PEZI|nr:Aldo/keto reductase family-domain-containing protein [Lasiosphaeria miniovina]KAK0709206.1 Aldo/keto reductase family-domain-containing protein [Lasiosphaeria miniovina]
MSDTQRSTSTAAVAATTTATTTTKQQPGAFVWPPLHTVLPPLILGTATFNTQYVADPLAMPYRDIVARAVELGVRAFDTSPYYGPSETLLGSALDALMNPAPSAADPAPVALPRSDFMLVTKAGRIVMDEFDYSPAWIRYSVLRSLQRLHTPYVDLVYCHDVEFVSPAEVLAAVRELRRLRDEDGVVRYVGISGFPVDVLCDLAATVLAETGEPLDAVLSYGHFTIQNRKLGLPWVDDQSAAESAARGDSPLARFKAAGVDVVLNASILGMGLLTSHGIPPDSDAPKTTEGQGESPSPLTKWHPSPLDLRLACKELARLAVAAGERLELVAIRWALEEWARVGAAANIGVDVSLRDSSAPQRLGATVCGVSAITELEETMLEWQGVLSGLGLQSTGTTGKIEDGPYGTARRERVLGLVQKGLWPALGPWEGYAWPSPNPGFANTRRKEGKGVTPNDDVIASHNDLLVKRNRGGKGSGTS